MLLISLILISILFATSLLCSCVSNQSNNSSQESNVKQDVTLVVIEDGLTIGQISDAMVDAGLVDNAQDFRDKITEMNATSRLKAGAYLAPKDKSLEEYVNMLVEGPEKYCIVLTVSEGMRLDEIAKKLEDVSGGYFSEVDFMTATDDATKYADEFPCLKEVGHQSLEGFMFPKTYKIYGNMTCDDIAKLMLTQYSKETSNLDYSYPASLGLSQYDVLKLASIVEKEVSPENFSRASGVFFNRLKDGMKLQSDATRAYELRRNPSAEELKDDTPYNTFKINGLPPTPICNPSKEALQAVCHPEIHDYYYFYNSKDSEGNTTCHFSQTYEEHDKVATEDKQKNS